VLCYPRRQRREEERLQREMQQREQEEALALLEGQKKRGKGIKLKVGFCDPRFGRRLHLPFSNERVRDE